ncbi:acyltransferase family protein, partial [Arthrobacter sp. TB 26]|uniref:acyltransferase family protein n=1 Tax=Arthrobacter sp. TB 26 TaxID=494420 RepID=UPI000462909B
MASPQQPGHWYGLRPDRDLVIDLARFFCLVLVVVGHTMMVSPVLHPDGTVTSDNTLGNQRWFEPVVWVLQVMPLFFVAGGITGLQSWRRLRARGGTAFDFMQGRMLRLIRPAAVLLAVMFTGLWAARLAGVDPQVIQLLASGAGMPLWFLAAYLAAQLNLPLLARLHARAPWLTLAGLTSVVVVVDCLRGTTPALAYLNMIFLWCAVQQLGFFLADGGPVAPGRPALAVIILGSNLVLGLLVWLGLYSGNMLVNLNPPNLTLLLLGFSQAAALQLFRPMLARVVSLVSVRRLIGVAGRWSMTVYLWHLPLLAAMSGLLLLTAFPQPAGGTAAWWWGRPLVLLALIGLLLPVLTLFGRLEERPTA